jgi:hypothetical protein
LRREVRNSQQTGVAAVLSRMLPGAHRCFDATRPACNLFTFPWLEINPAYWGVNS